MVTYPEDWTPGQLRDFGYIQMCRRIFQSQTKAFGAIPFYKISTFGGKADAYISQELYEKYKMLYPYPEKGDVLLSAAGTVGKAVIFDGKDSYFQDSNIVWLKVDKDVVDRNFLWWFYRSYPWDALEGTTIQRLYNNIILNTDIHLPSLPEQEEIAQTLSEFDTYIDDLTELIEKKKGIRDGALEDLICRKTRLVNLSDEWEDALLSDICKIYDGTHQTPKYTLTGVRFVSVENIADLHGSNKYISFEAYQSDFKVYPEKGDILMTRIGDIGTPNVVETDEPLAYYVSLALFKNITVNSRFLHYYIMSSTFQKELDDRTLHHATPKKINKGEIGKCKVAYPRDKKEQEAIAEVLTAMDKEIANLETEREKMIQIREGAMNDLLTGRVRLTK